MMTMQEKQLVEDHLYLVKNIILGTISVNESVQGLGYEDLYQTGCEALCNAAIHYNSERGANFATFANTVIRNYLISNCRKISRFQTPLIYMDAPIKNGTGISLAETFINEKDHLLTDVETSYLLNQAEGNYSGIARKGIQSIKLKLQGHTGADIAQYFGVKPNHIAAWITRAADKLRSDYYQIYTQ